MLFFSPSMVLFYIKMCFIEYAIIICNISLLENFNYLNFIYIKVIVNNFREMYLHFDVNSWNILSFLNYLDNNTASTGEHCNLSEAWLY